MYKVQSNEKLRELSRLIGISDEGYVDFFMGLIYSSTQALFREESGLSEINADNIFLEYWKKEGRNIRIRLLQKIEESEKHDKFTQGTLVYPPPERALELTTEFLDFITNQKKSLLDYQYFVDHLEGLHPDDRHKFFYNIAQRFKEKLNISKEM
jgi:hypothetical protein